MNPREIKEFLNGNIKIEVNSKYPAGQGYMPQIIQETHYNISINGHKINLTESAFNELLRVLENNDEQKIEKIDYNDPNVLGWSNIYKNVSFELDNKEKSGLEVLEALQKQYIEKFNKQVPPRYKNDIDWIEKALAE